MSAIGSLVEILSILDARKSEMSLLERKAYEESKSKATRNVLLAMTGGAFIGWFAGRKLDFGHRFMASAGTYEFTNRSIVYRQMDQILSMNGTWMQQEMANLLMRKNHHDPKLMGILSKYFYAEKVYDDLSDEPKLRWRRRTFFHESNATFEATESPDEHTPQSPNVHKPDQKRVPAKETNPRQKPAPMNNAVEVVENPFECIFGTVEVEEIHGSLSNATPKRHSHGSRRHHLRRHRKHHHEASEAV